MKDITFDTLDFSFLAITLLQLALPALCFTTFSHCGSCGKRIGPNLQWNMTNKQPKPGKQGQQGKGLCKNNMEKLF